MIGNRDRKLIKEFGQNLKKIRQQRDLSVRKLALEADMDFGNIGRIERGEVNPSLTTILTLAEALKVDASVLLPKK